MEKLLSRGRCSGKRKRSSGASFFVISRGIKCYDGESLFLLPMEYLAAKRFSGPGRRAILREGLSMDSAKEQHAEKNCHLQPSERTPPTSRTTPGGDHRTFSGVDRASSYGGAAGRKPPGRRGPFSNLPERGSFFRRLWKNMPPGRTFPTGSNPSGTIPIFAVALRFLSAAISSTFSISPEEKKLRGKSRGPLALAIRGVSAYLSLREESFPPSMEGTAPLCMSQYRLIFGGLPDPP